MTDTIISNSLSIISLVVALGAAAGTIWQSKIAADEKEENFRNKLQQNLSDAKLIIIELDPEKSFSHTEKMIFTEKINDLLLYQCFKKEKEKYLTVKQNNKLNLLQENIEDNIGCILSNTDYDTNKEQAIANLKNFKCLF